jgi:hypothetical protein
MTERVVVWRAGNNFYGLYASMVLLAAVYEHYSWRALANLGLLFDIPGISELGP